MPIIQILILLTLGLIFIQDIKNRAVYWIMFPILVILLLAERFNRQPITAIWLPVAINLVFLTIQLLLVTAYFSIKRGGWVNLASGLLGWGDILFLIAIAFYLSFLNFLVFYVASLIVVLLFWSIRQLMVKPEENHIPLAGLQALLLSVALVFDWWCFHLNLFADDWLLHYL